MQLNFSNLQLRYFQPFFTREQQDYVSGEMQLTVTVPKAEREKVCCYSFRYPYLNIKACIESAAKECVGGLFEKLN